MPANTPSPDQVTGTPGARPSPGPRWQRTFAGDAGQIGVLRQWLASLLPPCPARDDVTYVASELGTNAVRHTASGQGGSFEVEVTCYGPLVRVAVADGGAPGGPRLIDDPQGESGRGLLVVRSLAVRTGQRGDHRGRLIWADIPWDTAVAGPVSPDSREAAIGDGLASLASRFSGVQAWFGRSTLQWWALAGGELVSAPSAQELCGLLDHLLGAPSAPMSQGGGRARADAPGRGARGLGR
jgi:hypothetical protein